MENKLNERIKACKTQDELAEYLLKCVPILREYTEEATTKQEVRSLGGMSVSSTKGARRKDVFARYMSEVEDQTELHRVDPATRPCPRCGAKWSWRFDEISSEEICTQCGEVEYLLGEELGFKEEQEITKNIVYSYKRENHFNEWISQFQGKESTSVPPEVIQDLKIEFKKQKIKNTNEITHEKVKGVLKKMSLAKYYEHIPFIATILNGIQPPTMPQALEDRLRLMFHQIQKPFELHKPADRKNFLSYSYVLYKFCELLGEDSYLPCFPLLKSHEKLHVQDVIWQRICTELHWQFIPT